MLVDPTLKISVKGTEISARGKRITDNNRIDDIVKKFKSKYGEGDVKKYYTILMWQLKLRSDRSSSERKSSFILLSSNEMWMRPSSHIICYLDYLLGIVHR